MIYRGYKIEKSPNEKVGWNLYERLRHVKKWIWLWAYESAEKAKEAVDKHLGMEMEG